MNYYTQNAKALSERYNSMNSEDVHRPWRDLLPAQRERAMRVVSTETITTL